MKGQMAMPNESLYHQGDIYFDGLLEDIEAATSRIDLETYIFRIDRVGRRFVRALIRAAERGVRVRLMVDGVGLPFTSQNLPQMFDGSAVQIRIYHPIPWFFWHWKYTSQDRPLLRKLIDWLINLNHRNHRKTCVIDNKIAWVGSFNICDCHLPVALGGEGWRDSAVKLLGVDIYPLTRAFEKAWHAHRLMPPFPPWRDFPFRLNYTRYRRRLLLRDLIRRIERAQKRLWITNAYFVPDRLLLRKLAQAAHRGIDVRILLPERSDVFFMPWTSSVFYRQLLLTGVRIYEYQPAILHAKTIIIDDWMTVGSSNLNYRSLLHDLEVDVVLQQSSSKQNLASQFLADIKNAREISLASYPPRPWWQRWIAMLVLILERWL